jgi:hypothetical protein
VVARIGESSTFISSIVEKSCSAESPSASSRAVVSSLRRVTSRRHYRQRREHGDRHAAANRHLFNKLLGQLYNCLQNHQTFDGAKAFPLPCSAAA